MMTKWKKILGMAAAILVVLLLVTAFVGYTLLKSQGFHRYVLAKIVSAANQATGGRTEVRSVDFHWSTLSADLYDVTIHGAEPANAAPLFHVDKLTAGLKILSVVHRQVNLSQFEIEHPVVHLLIDRDGSTNIPHPAPTGNKSTTSVFDLAIGHVLLANGEIYYNDRKSALNADLQGLQSEITFNFLTTSYSGSLGYQNGHIQFADLAPMPHALDVRFSAAPSALTLAPVELRVGSSRLTLQATLSDYANPAIQGRYDISIHTQDFADMAKEVAPAGDITSSGMLRYHGAPNVSFLRSVFADGHFASNRIVLASSQGRVDVQELRGQYQLANGDLQIRNLLASLFRGELRADLAMRDLDAAPSTKLHASIRGISIEALRAAIRQASVRDTPLTGHADGSVDASWAGSVNNLRALSDVGIQGAILNSVGPAPSIPLKGAIHAVYDGRSQTLTLRQSTVQMPASSLVAQGQMSRHSNLSVQLRTSDLHELALLAPALQQASAAKRNSPSAAAPLNVSGAATVNALVQGSWQAPQLSAQVAAQNLQFEGSRWSSLRFGVLANPSQVALQNGDLVSAQQGRVQFNAKAGLLNWSYLPANPTAATVSIRQMPVAELARLARAQYPVTGDLSADVVFQGSQINPEGHGSAQLAKAKIYGEPVDTAAVQFQAGSGTIHSTLDIKLPAGELAAKLSYVPKTRAYELQLDAPSIQLDQLHSFEEKKLPLAGAVNISAHGAGTLDDPHLTATLRLPQLQIQQTTITAINADLNVANQRANITMTSVLAQATLRAQATVNLAGDYYTEASLDTSRVPLDPLLAIYMANRPDGFQGETELHATLKGPLKNQSQLEAHVVVPALNASYKALQIANAGPLRLDYANSVVTLQPAELKGTETSLRFQGRVPLANEQPISILANGSLDMRLLQIFVPGLQSGGVVAVDVRTSGSARQPVVQGQIRLQDVALLSQSAPLGLEHTNGTLDLANDQLHITQLTAQVGGGQLSAGGAITYRPRMQFNVALDAKSIRLRYPDGVRTLLDGNLALVGNQEQAALNGRVLIDSLSFTSDFDTATLIDQFSGNSSPPIGDTFADRVKLNVTVQSTDALSAASSQLSIEGQANLRVTGTATDPILLGRMEMTSGDIFFMKQRYQLERGVIDFTNPARTRPVVNILMTTTINQYNLSLRVTGPIEKLTTSYVSDPPLPPVDIINLIARGQTTEESSPSTLGANQVLAQGVASQLSGSVEKLAGISSLQIDPLLGGSNRNPSARVAVQKRVTRNFIFTFSTDVTDPQSEIIQGEYRINRRWSVSATRDEGGGVAVDGRYHTIF
jgi:translocation and assembly module TamB